MRLVEIFFPVNYYTFSNNNQNTKFKVELISTGLSCEIPIKEGFYNPDQLANEIQNDLTVCTDNSGWRVLYNTVCQKYVIGNKDVSFNLCFDASNITYDLSDCYIHLTRFVIFGKTF